MHGSCERRADGAAGRSGGEARLDQRDGGGDGVLDPHRGGVEQHRILGRAQRRRRPRGIPRIALAQLDQHLGGVGAQLGRAAGGAGLGAGDDLQLDLGLGANDRADVTPVKDRARLGA